MADRYWVGGTANWDGTAGTKWATISGGGGGASVPTTSDNVFIDVASGTVTVTIASGNTGCLDLNMSGFTGTVAGNTNITVAGSLTYGSGMTPSSYVGTFNMNSTSSRTITTNGYTSPGFQKAPWFATGRDGRAVTCPRP